MQLTVKTLKGGKFQVECEPGNSVADIKGIIEAAKSELPAANMKLIHSGKVLKDEDSIDSCGIKPNDFLVVMITKPKKAPEAPAAAAPAAAAAAPEAPTTTDRATPAATGTDTAPPPVSSATESSPPPAAATTAAPPVATAVTAPTSSTAGSDEFPAEVIANLTGLGFPEAEVRHCLRAARGHPDVAVEFLTNGIPPGLDATSSSSSSSSQPGAPLQALRNHPQLNALRRLVQSNPQMLQQVLTQIGQQQPELLQEINANQAAFLEMMNEPVDETAAAPPPVAAPTNRGGISRLMAGGLPAMANPMQMAEIFQNMSTEELNHMAAVMGVTADQLRATAQLVGQIPPEQFQEHMMQAMQQMPPEQLQEYMLQAAMQPGGAGNMMGMMDDEEDDDGTHFVQLTPDEMAAVERLAEMGFDHTEAVQAFLACDKNEALAANLLMDSLADGGGGGAFGFGGRGSGGGGNSNNNNNNNNQGGDGDEDDDDDMYD